MKHKPIISIVTPSFNQGGYIEDTIRSVLSQKGDFYIDYIIMDGGSTDNSVTVIRHYEKLLKKNCSTAMMDGLSFYVRKNKGFELCRCSGVSFRWLSEKDRGQTHAINKGIRMIRGEFFAWINSDDYYAAPEIFQSIINFFHENPGCAMAYGRGRCVDENKKFIRDYHDNCSSLSFDRSILKYQCYILQPAAFIRSDVMTAIGELDESLHWCMDWDLWLKISASHAVKFIPRWLAVWRQYEGIKSLEGDYNYFKERYSIIRKYSTYIEYIINKWYYYMLYPGHLKFHVWLKYKPNRILMALFYACAKAFHALLNLSGGILAGRTTSPKKRRLAVFTPLEPLQTGVATYFTKILKSLAKEKPDLFIDIFIDDGYVPIDFKLPNVRILNHKFFPMNSMYYDAIFHQMGNHHVFHGYMIPYIMKYMGITEMHDIKIQGIYARIIDDLKKYLGHCKFLKTIRQAVLFPELIHFIIAGIFRPVVQKEAWLEGHLYRKSFAVRKSKKIIIRDESLCSRFRLPREKCEIIIHGMDIKPLTSEGEKARIRRKLRIGKNQFVIVTAGIIHNSKRIDKVLKALGTIKDKMPKFIYVLAGESIWEGGTIEELIRSNGLEGRVRVTGWIPAGDWLDYITIADIGINLRGNSSGEQSGPLSNLFERGKVVLISDYDQFKIYPDEFAVKIKLDAHEVDSLAGAILKQYSRRDRLKRAGSLARRYAEEELDLDKKIIKQYCNVLEL
jgi:glycosyltransferase involved in cell wall biosynthesis